jgi:hypothetical protein
MITYKPMAGDNISSTSIAVVDIANEKIEIVYFDFNGIQILVHPGDKPKDIAQLYYRNLGLNGTDRAAQVFSLHTEYQEQLPSELFEI